MCETVRSDDARKRDLIECEGQGARAKGGGAGASHLLLAGQLSHQAEPIAEPERALVLYILHRGLRCRWCVLKLTRLLLQIAELEAAGPVAEPGSHGAEVLEGPSHGGTCAGPPSTDRDTFLSLLGYAVNAFHPLIIHVRNKCLTETRSSLTRILQNVRPLHRSIENWRQLRFHRRGRCRRLT